MFNLLLKSTCRPQVDLLNPNRTKDVRVGSWELSSFTSPSQTSLITLTIKEEEEEEEMLYFISLNWRTVQFRAGMKVFSRSP